MSNEYMNLDHIPSLNHPGYPYCGTCSVEVEHDGDGWVCPSCGTAWDSESMEYDEGQGMRFEDWSGEERTGPIAPKDEAWRWSGLPSDARDKAIQEWAAKNS